MKLFKKALLATAVFGAMGAQAATVSSDPVKLSAEGIAAGLTADQQEIAIDFVLNEITPAASVITLTFDENVDLQDLETLIGSTELTIVNDPNTGTGQVDTAADNEVQFSYGTGSFTFDRFIVDADAGTIKFEVNLGNAITANSAFRMTIAAAGLVDIDGAASVTYSSVTSGGTAIETGSGVIAVEEKQFSARVKQGYDGRIERLEQVTFAKNASDADNQEDTIVLAVTDNADNLSASLTSTLATFTIEGNFANGKDGGDELTSAAFATGLNTAPTLTDEDTLAAIIDVANDGLTTDGKDNNVTITYDTTGVKLIPVTGDLEVSATVSVSDAGVDPIKVATGVDGGAWALDATVINVPYFPVGFEGLSTSVHFANESANAADVIITAIDQAGNEYSSSALADLAGDTVTKVSQVTIMDLLGAPAGSKLSVTFNIDANDGDVNAYAFSNAGTGRQALVTSQEKGIK